MEQFRLRIRNPAKLGHVWELHLFPQIPKGRVREADGRLLSSASAPEATHWLRGISDAFLKRAEHPRPITAEEFGPLSTPRWLRIEDGMRLALAFSAARYLGNVKQRRKFTNGLKQLPSEVILYWFTLCFYGYRQAAGRAALRTLLTHEEPQRDSSAGRARRVETSRPYSAAADKDGLAGEVREALATYGEKVLEEKEAKPRQKEWTTMTRKSGSGRAKTRKPKTRNGGKKFEAKR